jgi:hypothetical protein
MQKLYNPSFSIGKRLFFKAFFMVQSKLGGVWFFWGHNSSRLSFVGLLLFGVFF